MRRLKKIVSLGSCVGVALVLAPVALAQAQDCFPPCRAGFTCQAGACVEDQPVASPQPDVPDQTQQLGTPSPWVQQGQQTGAPQGTGSGPAWGPGSAGAGSATWSPETAPPTPLTDEERDRITLRTSIRFVLYGMVGLHPEEFYDTSTGGFDASTDVSVGGGFGLGIRTNFTRAFGLQARALMSFDTANLEPRSTWADTSWDAELMGIDIMLELGVRLGPVSDSVPWYFGVFGGVGDRVLIGDSLCMVSEFAGHRMCGDPFGQGMEYAEGEVIDLGHNFIGGDLGAETGFVFGDREQFDLGLRFNALTDLNGSIQWGLLLFLGWAVI